MVSILSLQDKLGALTVSSSNFRSCKFFSALACWFPEQLELGKALFGVLIDTGGDAPHCKLSSMLNGWELNLHVRVGTLWFWLSLLTNSRQPDRYQTLFGVLIGEIFGSDYKQPTA